MKFAYLTNQLRELNGHPFSRRLQKTYQDITKVSEEAVIRCFQSSSGKKKKYIYIYIFAGDLYSNPALPNAVESCVRQKESKRELQEKSGHIACLNSVTHQGPSSNPSGPFQSIIKEKKQASFIPLDLYHLLIKKLWASFISERNFAIPARTSNSCQEHGYS